MPDGRVVATSHRRCAPSTLEHPHGIRTGREARHRLGLTQRQANGKFTVGEADELIAQLTEVAEEGGAAGSAESVVAATRADDRLARQRDEILAGMPADALADELTRRGWLCMPPP